MLLNKIFLPKSTRFMSQFHDGYSHKKGEINSYEEESLD
jgi:hypothetical protein